MRLDSNQRCFFVRILQTPALATRHTHELVGRDSNPRTLCEPGYSRPTLTTCIPTNVDVFSFTIQFVIIIVSIHSGYSFHLILSFSALLHARDSNPFLPPFVSERVTHTPACSLGSRLQVFCTSFLLLHRNFLFVFFRPFRGLWIYSAFTRNLAHSGLGKFRAYDTQGFNLLLYL